VGADRGEAGADHEVRHAAQVAIDAVARVGTASVDRLGDAVDAAGRTLARRAVSSAVAGPRDVEGRDDLTRALTEQPHAPALGGATAAAFALAVRRASRLGPLRFLGRRMPLWFFATMAPMVIASLSRGSDELGLVASHLAHRARAAGVEPDPERIRRVAVQIASGQTVDPDREPSHGPLLVAWLRRALRAVLPLSGGVSTRDPKRLAAAANGVDPTRLAAG
jgi:hypothetical protein